MSRLADIREKLAYAETRSQELGRLIHDASIKGTTVKHLGVMAGEILACSREVLDFCAINIVEQVICPADPDVAKKFAEGKIKCYFPLYINQLTSNNNVLTKLSTINPKLHAYLLAITEKIERRAIMTDTQFDYGWLREVADMVNEKKHVRLLQIAEGPKAVHVRTDIMEISFVPSKQVGVSLTVAPGANVVEGATYVFEANNEEVWRYCQFTKGMVARIVDEIYSTFLK